MENITVQVGNTTVDIHPILPEIPLRKVTYADYNELIGLLILTSPLTFFVGCGFLYSFAKIVKWMLCVKIKPGLKKKKMEIVQCAGECDCSRKKKKDCESVNCSGEMEIIHTTV